MMGSEIVKLTFIRKLRICSVIKKYLITARNALVEMATIKEYLMVRAEGAGKMFFEQIKLFESDFDAFLGEVKEIGKKDG